MTVRLALMSNVTDGSPDVVESGVDKRDPRENSYHPDDANARSLKEIVEDKTDDAERDMSGLVTSSPLKREPSQALDGCWLILPSY